MNDDMNAQKGSREQVIVRTSFIGIGANVLLAAFKAAIGILSNSIAVTLDAVNNLSDAMSSVITIVGTKLAEKKPDKKHPMGYGRIEYLSAMVVAAIVLYAGITSLVESFKKIIHPEEADYGPTALVIIAAAVIVKLILGRYVKSVGEKVNSGSLVASGSDALFDAILSSSVLVAAIIFTTTGISLEAYVGVVISGFIIKAGLEMLTDTLDEILGKRITGEESKAIKDTVCEEPEVSGAYDLLLHNYGPDRLVGSVHVEVPESMTAEEIDGMTRRIQANVYRKHGVALAAVGIYSINVSGGEGAKIRNEVTELVMSHEHVLQMHGFYIDMEKAHMTFDIVTDFDVDRDEFRRQILSEISDKFPNYTIHVAMDTDISD